MINFSIIIIHLTELLMIHNKIQIYNNFKLEQIPNNKQPQIHQFL